jgi:hypothetical protein
MLAVIKSGNTYAKRLFSTNFIGFTSHIEHLITDTEPFPCSDVSGVRYNEFLS